jgi:hypothetical protein
MMDSNTSDSDGIDDDGEEPEADVHKLEFVKHACALKRPVFGIINGQYAWDRHWEEVQFWEEVEAEALEDMMDMRRKCPKLEIRDQYGLCQKHKSCNGLICRKKGSQLYRGLSLRCITKTRQI